jgi:MFS family permease
MIVLALAYREPKRAGGGARLDLAGAATITIASLALLLAASRVEPITMSLAGVLLFALFFAIERRAADPVVPIPLLRRRLIAVANTASFLLGAAMMGVLNFLPLHVQGVLGGMPVEAGLVIAPMLVGWPIASAATSRMLTRIGYRRPVWLGTSLTTIGLALLAPLVMARAPSAWLGAAMLLFGLGMGLVNTAILIGVQASVGWEERGVATGTTMFARSMGGALGVGALGALLAQRLEQTISSDVASDLLNPDRRAEALAVPGVVEALGAALDPLFWGGAIAAVLTAIVVVAYPRDERASSRPPPAPAPGPSAVRSAN